MPWFWQSYERFHEARSSMQSFLDLHTDLGLFLFVVMEFSKIYLLYLGVPIVVSRSIVLVISFFGTLIPKLFFLLKDLYKHFTSLDLAFIPNILDTIFSGAIVLATSLLLLQYIYEL
jgi:hypothetical protein